MVQGVTAYYLSHLTFAVKPGHTVLVHAAAGGVGLLLTQMAKRAGAVVIATVSTAEKARLAREAGADEVIIYTQSKFDEEVLRITKGIGLDVVYDGVGQSTFEQSLKCLRGRGLLALYGAASGPVPPFDLWRSASSVLCGRPLIIDFVSLGATDAYGRDLLMGWHRIGAKIITRSEESRTLAETIIGVPIPMLVPKPRWRRQLSEFLLRRTTSKPATSAMTNSSPSALEHMGDDFGTRSWENSRS